VIATDSRQGHLQVVSLKKQPEVSKKVINRSPLFQQVLFGLKRFFFENKHFNRYFFWTLTLFLKNPKNGSGIW